MSYIDVMINKYGEELAMELIEELLDWRDIEGYEGLYKVSEWGDIMSIGHGKKKLLKQSMNGDGYYHVNLCKDGHHKYSLVHRLVATAFCEGAGEFECVNHIDEIKSNNHYTNLEWCTAEYNNAYGSRSNSVPNFQKRRVRCVELDMIFESLTSAAKYVGGKRKGITNCLLGRIKTHRDYHWERID